MAKGFKWSGWLKSENQASTDSIQFYDDGNISLHIPSKLVDNGTTDVAVETLEGWKCERENCRIDFIHSHGIYDSLKV